MKNKWKYDKARLFGLLVMLKLYILGIAIVMLVASCNHNNSHSIKNAAQSGDLDGLVQPTNQTVFSDIETIYPTLKSVGQTIKASGIITYNPELINNISARYSGRIVKLYVRYNFEKISKGQRIMDVYSPDVLTAQEDLIYILKNSPDDINLINSAKLKLQYLGVTAKQLKQIELKKMSIDPLPIYSPYAGHIHDIGISGSKTVLPVMNNNMSEARNNSISTTQDKIENLPSSESSALSIREGMYVQSGQAIFSVYTVSQVWAVINIFSKDAASVKVGDKVTLTLENRSDNLISTTISYIEPITGPNGYTIKARVYLSNNDAQFKIGTFVSSKIISHTTTGLWLPRKALVSLGQNQTVFLRKKDHYILKYVKTGVETDSLIQILSGVTALDAVAADAQFMVDSESFIKSENDDAK